MKKFMRLASVGLACMMCIVAGNLAAFAAPTVTQYIANVDFSTYEEGDTIESTADFTANASVFQGATDMELTVVKDPIDGETNVLKMEYMSADSVPTAREAALIGRGTYTGTLETAFMITSDNSAEGRWSFCGIDVANVTNQKLTLCSSQTIDLELNRWYYLTAAVAYTAETTSITCYLDGEQVITYSTASVTTSRYNQTRMSFVKMGKTTGTGEVYVKYWRAISLNNYGTTAAAVDNATLTSPAGPVEVSFDSPVLPQTVKAENVQITSMLDGVEVPEFTVTPKLNADGNATGMTIAFAEDLLNDNSYTVGLSGIVDTYGYNVTADEEKMTFNAPAADYVYSFGDIRLYQGIGSTRTEIQALEAGLVSVEIPVTNEGAKTRAVTLVVAVYEGDTLTDIQYVTYNMPGAETVTVSAGCLLEEVTANTRLDVMMWKTATDAEPLMDKVTLTK